MKTHTAWIASDPSGWPLRAQHALALGTVALALLLRWSLDPLVGEYGVPFGTLFPALLVLVLTVRTRPFVLSALMGAVGVLVLFIPPRFSLSTGGAAGVWQLVLFGAAVGAGAWLSRRVRTSREGAERELARRTAEIRLVTDAVPALISYVDAGERYRFVNARYADWFGAPPEAIVGRTMKEVLDPGAYAQVRRYVESALAGTACRYEAELPFHDGRTRHVVAEYVPHVLEGGVVDGFFAMISDVGDQKRAEAAQARLAAIVETSGDAITSISLDGTFLSWNAGAERLFGYTAEEAVGQKVDLLRSADGAADDLDILDRVRAGHVVGPYDTVRRAKDGREVEVSVTVSPVRDASRDVVGVSKVDRDISGRLAVERALRERERELSAARARERAYLDHLPVGIWFADARGRLTYANEAGARIWGSTATVEPTRFDDVEAYPHGSDRSLARHERPIHRALEHGEAVLGEVLDIVAFDGTRHTVLDSTVPVRDENGDIVAAVVMNLDITELKRAEAALKEADRRKDEFLAALAHELRNPLAAVRSATELLASAPAIDAELLDHAVQTVGRQVGVMVRLVDDLLDVSRITRGTLELRRASVELRRLVEEAVASLRPWIEQKGHTVEVALPEEPVELTADGVRLGQVLTNVLGNAIDYTDAGGRIDVVVRRDGDEAVVDVRDNGIGIPKDELDRIFGMFTRLEPPARAQTGLGIGLSLSRQLVEMHGGRLQAYSEGPGCGTTVTLRLPLARSTAGAAEPQPVPAATSDTGVGTRRRVLVVDDNADAADMLAILLAAHGHEVRTAGDGRSALAEAADFRPDAVLLDIGLPDMDGVEVCRTLRSEPWGRDALVVAVSGWGQEEDKRRTAEAGFDAHLTKPARIEQVVRVLERGREPAEVDGSRRG